MMEPERFRKKNKLRRTAYYRERRKRKRQTTQNPQQPLGDLATSVPPPLLPVSAHSEPTPARKKASRGGKRAKRGKGSAAKSMETQPPGTPAFAEPRASDETFSSKRSRKRKRAKKQAGMKKPRVDSSAVGTPSSPMTVPDTDDREPPVAAVNRRDVVYHSTPQTKTTTPRQIQYHSEPPSLNKLAVAMLKGRSARLQREGAFIGIFLRDSVLCFEGCVQMRVLVGLVHVRGYVYKPSTWYHPLYSPIGHPPVNISALNPDMQDADFEPYFAPLRRQSGVHFHSLSESSRLCDREGCVYVDLDAEDISVLETMTKDVWRNTIALVLFKSLNNDITSMLHYCTSPSVFNVVPQLIEGFHTMPPVRIHDIPAVFRNLAWDVLAYNRLSLLVCGSQGTGKSTLCRYLINYLLNRYPSVCYLECDVGQPDFTTPEVLSLHMVSEPITGPPYTHQRKAYKSYFFGDNSPRVDPEYYLRIIRTLYRDFTSLIRAVDPAIPLVVNTCGWTNGMGEQLLLDLIRSISPSHIIRLVRDYSETPKKEMAPFTEDLLANKPGLFTACGNYQQYHHLHHPSSHASLNVSGSSAGTSMSVTGEGCVSCEPGEECIVISDSDEETSKLSEKETTRSTDQSSLMESSSVVATPVKADVRVPKQTARPKGRSNRQQMKYYRQLLRMRVKQRKEIRREMFHDKEWVSVLSHRVMHILCNTHSKRSPYLRKLSLVAYFSPLFPVILSVAKELSVSNPHSNMLCCAPPLQVPWSDVAVHILHKNVPREQILYTLNSQFVALGSVKSEEIINTTTPGMFKLLKSQTPLIEFIGLGLLRGIDVDKRLFFLTTPEGSEQLEKVNVLVLGNTEKLSWFASNGVQDCRAPYYLKNFQPVEGGRFAWSSSR